MSNPDIPDIGRAYEDLQAIAESFYRAYSTATTDGIATGLSRALVALEARAAEHQKMVDELCDVPRPRTGRCLVCSRRDEAADCARLVRTLLEARGGIAGSARDFAWPSTWCGSCWRRPMPRLEAKTYEILCPVLDGVHVVLKARLFVDGNKVVGVRSLRLSQLDGTGIETRDSGVEDFEDHNAKT